MKNRKATPTPPQPYQRKRMTYTEDQKIAAVAILLQHSDPDSKGLSIEGIALAREYLKANASLDTLSKWLTLYRDKVQQAEIQPTTIDSHMIQVISTAKSTALESMQRIRDKLLQQAETALDHNAIPVANMGDLRNAMVSIAVMQDKIKDATGMSVAMQQAIRPLAILCDEREIDVYALIEDMIHAVRSMTDEQIEAYKNRRILGTGNNI